MIGTAHCWICEGWKEIRFHVKKISSLQHIEDPVFIHFEFDDWEPGLLTLQEGAKDTWECYRRIPPGQHRYFYSVVGHAGIAKDQPKVHAKDALHIHVEYQVEDEHLTDR